jgi:hypothetical protein
LVNYNATYSRKTRGKGSQTVAALINHLKTEKLFFTQQRLNSLQILYYKNTQKCCVFSKAAFTLAFFNAVLSGKMPANVAIPILALAPWPRRHQIGYYNFFLLPWEPRKVKLYCVFCLRQSFKNRQCKCSISFLFVCLIAEKIGKYSMSLEELKISF